jgi:glycosyltransferase involved in cell wall biosynthesis
MGTVPVTVLLAARNEEANLSRCLSALAQAERVIVLDSYSTDGTAQIALEAGVDLVQFEYRGGYPKKRQWALDELNIRTEWVLLIDADEVVPAELWDEIATAIAGGGAHNAYFITKGFHFLNRGFRWGGFSFAAVLLIKRGKAHFEEILGDVGEGLDMEVHERMIVDGSIGRLRTPLVHDDFKGLYAYIDRHNRYSSWEAELRHRFLNQGQYGKETIQPRLFGNTQERRRWLKGFIIRFPGEPLLWFTYHYFLRLGLLEGRRGLIACFIRSWYIATVRAKMYEIALTPPDPLAATHSQ